MISLKRQAHLPYKQSFSTISFEINVIRLTELTSQNITAITTLYLRICLGHKSNVDRRNLSVISWLAPTWLPLLLFRVPARLSLRVGRLLEELSVWWKNQSGRQVEPRHHNKPRAASQLSYNSGSYRCCEHCEPKSTTVVLSQFQKVTRVHCSCS